MIDLSEAQRPPDWVIVGEMEAGCVTMMAADSGAAKSLLAQALTVAVARGQGSCWLGEVAEAAPVIYVDGENHARLISTRLRALGGAASDPIMYHADPAIIFGEHKPCGHTERLRSHVRASGARLVVIDTVSSSLAADVNKGVEVVDAYRSILRPVAREGCAVLILHHERKPDSRGGRGDPRHAVMGARHWGTQADGQYALLASPDGVQVQTSGDVERRSFGVTASCVKGRDGQSWDRELRVISRGPVGLPSEWLRVVRADDMREAGR